MGKDKNRKKEISEIRRNAAKKRWGDDRPKSTQIRVSKEASAIFRCQCKESGIKDLVIGLDVTELLETHYILYAFKNTVPHTANALHSRRHGFPQGPEIIPVRFKIKIRNTPPGV